MKNNVLSLTVALVVGVILVGSLVAPTITALTDETRTYTNDGVPYIAFDGESHEIVVSMDSDSNLSITSDGESTELPDFSLFGTVTIVYGSDGFLRLSSEGVLQYYAESYGSMTVAESAPVTVTVSSTGISMTNGTTTKASEFTPLAYIASEGGYVLAENPCVVADSSIIVIAGYTNISSGNRISFLANGTLDNLAVSTAYLQSTDSLTVSSVTADVNTTESDGELVRVDSIVFTATMSDDSEWSGTYTYFLAPYEIVYDNPDYVGSTLAPIMLAIIVITILGLVMTAARAVTRE